MPRQKAAIAIPASTSKNLPTVKDPDDPDDPAIADGIWESVTGGFASSKLMSSASVASGAMRQLLSGTFAIERYYRFMEPAASPSDLPAELSDLTSLGEPILAEVVREAEQMVDAQFAAIVAGDQRALTLAGIAATISGGAAGLLVAKDWPDSQVPEKVLAGLLIGVALLLLVAAALAVAAAMPSRFLFPGNEPANWHPMHWLLPEGRRHTLRAARVEQAIVLQAKIDANRKAAFRQARLVRRAVYLGFAAIGGGIVVLISAYLIGMLKV